MKVEVVVKEERERRRGMIEQGSIDSGSSEGC